MKPRSHIGRAQLIIEGPTREIIGVRPPSEILDEIRPYDKYDSMLVPGLLQVARAAADFNDNHIGVPRVFRLDKDMAGGLQALVPDQMQSVVQEAMRGHTIVAIAENIGITEATARTHLSRFCDRLGAHGILGAMSAAEHIDIVDSPSTSDDHPLNLKRVQQAILQMSAFGLDVPGCATALDIPVAECIYEYQRLKLNNFVADRCAALYHARQAGVVRPFEEFIVRQGDTIDDGVELL